MGFISPIDSKNIKLQINGNDVAFVKSYITSASKKNNDYFEIFNQEPFETITKVEYTITLCKFILTSLNIDFFDLENFTVTIITKDKKVKYDNCNWQKIEQFAFVNKEVYEKVVFTANLRQIVTD